MSLLRKISVVLFLCGGLCLNSCGKQEEQPAPATQEKVALLPKPALDPTQAATLRGRVFYSGSVPQPQEIKMSGNPECSAMQHGPVYSEELVVHEGKLQNVVVFVKEGLEGVSWEQSTQPVLIDQKSCVFVPHVVAVQANQPIELLNNDDTLHNVNARPKNSKGFNIGFPVKGLKRTVKLTEPECAVPIRCDLHPWMQGYIAVLSHPYFQVTGPDGAFEIANLPAGKYVIETWHEKLGTRSTVVEIQPKEIKEVVLEY